VRSARLFETVCCHRRQHCLHMLGQYGALLGATGLATMDQVKGLIEKTFAKKPKVVASNEAALARGYAAGKSAAPQAAN